jgi:hypothetical protein
MGWSCNRDASLTMEKVTKACIDQTGTQNEFRTPRGSYFYEISRTEHYDGAITGSVWKTLPGGTHCTKAGTFRIDGDGTFAHGPAFMKQAALSFC